MWYITATRPGFYEASHVVWEMRRLENVSIEAADEGLYKPAKNACIWVETSFRKGWSQTAGRSGRATRQLCSGVFSLIATRDLRCNLSCDIVILRESSVKKMQ